MRRNVIRKMIGGRVLVAVCVLAAATAARGETIWIRADAAQLVRGPLVLGQKAGIVEDAALGDFLASPVSIKPGQHDGGEAQFVANAPRSATYYTWVRIRCPDGTAGTFTLTVAGKADAFAPGSLVLGGPGAGPERWHWAPATSASALMSSRLAAPAEPAPIALAAGLVRLRIEPRQADQSVFTPGRWRMARPDFNPRLNLLCLSTDPRYVPTDADAEEALAVKPVRIDPAEMRVRPEVLPPLAAADWQRLGKQPIPDWLRCPRFFTKDSWRQELADRRPGDIRAMVRQIAASEGTAFRLSGYWGGDAYYPSDVTPRAPGLGALDYLREATDEGQRLGVKIVLYINPNALYHRHPLLPEVAVRRADGQSDDSPAYQNLDTHYVCINHPQYRDFLSRLLTEAFTRYPLAGLYVDGLTPHRCFCPHCRKKYQRMWGEPMPVAKLAAWRSPAVLWEMVAAAEPLGDPADPQWQHYTAFLRESLREATQVLAKAVKRCRPEAAVMLHSWPKPDTLALYDATLTEVYLTQPWRYRLWKTGELASYSNIFPVPVLFNIYLHDHGTEAEARTKMFQGLSAGCYPNCWNVLAMQPVFRFMRENAASLDFARTSPVPFLAFPRSVTHDWVQRRMAAEQRPWDKAESDRFLTAYVGMYSALVRQGLPVVSMQRSNFAERLGGFRVLCLANEAAMSDQQIAAVRQFVARGGGLVATQETSLYDERGNRRNDFGLADLFGVHADGLLPPARRELKRITPHAVTARLDAAESVTHEASLVRVRSGCGEIVAQLRRAGTTDEPATAVVVNHFGAGRVVYLAPRFDMAQCRQLSPLFERLLGNAVRWVADGQTPIEIEAAGPVSATLFQQPGRLLLHLVDLQGDPEYHSDAVQPLDNVVIRWRMPNAQPPRAVRALWSGAAIPFQIEGDRIICRLPRLEQYELLRAELAN